jgi:tetratricopeptide (TPR) repeat protein
MANTASGRLCPEDKITSLLSLLNEDGDRGFKDLERLLADFPNDPRLHFLKGSLLAGKEDYAAARVSMRRAVDLAPEYAVARFQLGFLLLTSGEPFPAQEAWGPLHALPADHHLHLFVEGLCHLIRDEFKDAVRLLERGIDANKENQPMNRDMQLIIDEIHDRVSGSGAGAASSVDFLLQQAALRKTKH